MSKAAPHPLLRLDFYGPYRPTQPQGRERLCQHYQTLAHWIEAGRFDPWLQAEAIEAVLLTPTAKLAIRAAKRRESLWRSDWRLIAPKVIAQGISQMRLYNPGHPAWASDAAMREFLGEALEYLETPDWMVEVAVERAVALREASRVLVLGGREASPREVGRRVTALHRRAAAVWNLVHWAGRNGSISVHDWADQNYLPIQTEGEYDERLTEARGKQLWGVCDLVIVFEQRGAKSLDRFVKWARAAGKQVETALWGEAPPPARSGRLRGERVDEVADSLEEPPKARTGQAGLF